MFIRLAVFFGLAMVLALTAWAQSNYATLRGEVTDPQHLRMPGAKVRIASNLTGVEREVVTDTAGLYVAAGLQPGAYQVAIEKIGFAEATQTLQLEVGQKATLDVSLALGTLAQSVNVSVSGELLRTANRPWEPWWTADRCSSCR